MKYIPVLDRQFRPAILENKAFREAVRVGGHGVPLVIALERDNGLGSNYITEVFPDDADKKEASLIYIERLLKTLLWVKGAYKVTIGGPAYIGEYIKNIYTPGGLREFDARFMEKVYKKPFSVKITDADNVPRLKEETKALGRNLNGNRIGFDAGGSDRKVSAVIDGRSVYSEEVVWHPKTRSDPRYHYNEILTAFKTAASHLPVVDAIGVSAAGIYVNNRVRVASLFIKVPDDLFKKDVEEIFINLAGDMGNVPLEVVNDGDVSALAGAMELNDTGVLGIAMGTSEAAGYVDNKGNITGWLNELAFAPIDFNSEGAVDEWSGDIGCGVKYFSQDAVIRLSPAAGIKLEQKLTPAEKLKVVQEFHDKGDERAERIFQTIGTYLGYTIAHYADFYHIKHIPLLGRVTSGKGGDVIVDTARKVLKGEFPALAKAINLYVPDEASRRVGQSIAAASLPEVK